jgi:hypothetical protein
MTCYIPIWSYLWCAWLVGQVGWASAAAWTHVPHHVSWCGPSLHVSHFPNQIESANCCPALLPALMERQLWSAVSPDTCVRLRVEAESIEWFFDDQVFSPSYDLAPSPSPPPRPPASCLFLSLLGCRSSLLTGEVARGWDRSQIIR